jgi:3-deoxy-D-manno-octulosonic acid kinase
MTKDGGQRTATSSGAMLADPRSLGNVRESIFEPAYWAARGELLDVARGRGSAWFIITTPNQWVLRHFKRGGWIARFSKDRYVWAGETRVRSFAEWRLLDALMRRGLPVPRPLAARYQRTGPLYRCDLITERISNAVPLSERMGEEPLDAGIWRAVGATVARFHAAGVDHADLNCHNILLEASGRVSVIDFDRGRIRSSAGADAGATGWKAGNLARLHRSLVKVARALPRDRFDAAAWDSLLAGYRSA